MSKKESRALIDRVFILLGVVAVIGLVSIGLLTWRGYTFATNQVISELSAQKIYFPEAGAASFSADEYPGLQQYAGQLVDDGIKARAYANEYIGHHLEKIAGGKTYAEVSALAQKDPTNTQLQQQKQTLFQGETLRGMLLGNGYAFWTFGQIARYVSLTAFGGALLMSLLVVLGLAHLQKA